MGRKKTVIGINDYRERAREGAVSVNTQISSVADAQRIEQVCQGNVLVKQTNTNIDNVATGPYIREILTFKLEIADN